MSIDTRKRVLVVEDDQDLRETYVAGLAIEFPKFRVDEAANLTEARDAVERCTYHLALVDLGLSGPRDRSNLDGRAVLRWIGLLGEGTSAVVVTGHDDPQLARDVLLEDHAVDYQSKPQLLRTGMAPLFQKVQRAVETSTVGGQRDWDEVAAVFGAEREEYLFVSELLQALPGRGGFENVSRALISVASKLAPLVPRIDPPRGLVRDGHGFSGTFWSKAQAMAVRIHIGTSARAVEAAGDLTDLLVHRDRDGLSAVAHSLPDLHRRTFIPGLAE